MFRPDLLVGLLVCEKDTLLLLDSSIRFSKIAQLDTAGLVGKKFDSSTIRVKYPHFALHNQVETVYPVRVNKETRPCIYFFELEKFEELYFFGESEVLKLLHEAQFVDHTHKNLLVVIAVQKLAALLIKNLNYLLLRSLLRKVILLQIFGY